MGANQGLQLQPIQTASGAVYAFAGQTITVPGLPTALSNTQLAPVTVPMHGVMTSQGMISGLSLQPQAPQSALQPQQSLFGTAVPFSNHVEQPSQVIQVPQPLAAPQQVATNHQSHLQNQPQQIEHSPVSSPQKPKVPTLNLEKLMKESGIVPSPESQIIQSPDCNSPVVEEVIQSHLDMNSSQLITALQSSQQVILEQSPGHTVIPQLKLAFGDGSVILHQPATLNNNSRLQHYISSGQIHGRTVNTTVGSIVLTSSASTSVVSVPVVTTESTFQNHSTLISRLNAAPVISVPDASTLAVTTNIVTSTTNVPLTVQSLNDGNPSSYVVQRTNTLTSTSDRVFVSETVLATQTHTTPVISTSSSIQNVQRINHSNPALQTIIVSNEHNVRTVPQSSHTVLVSTLSSQNAQPVLQKYGQQDLKIQEIIDSGAVVPNHNHPHSSHVPNTVSNLLEKIQKEITELNFVKNRTPEQNKIFQLLQQLKQKNCTDGSSKSFCKQRVFSTVDAKNPALTVQQQSGQLDKSQHTNSKPLASRSLQLVNLLKQSPSHIAPTKHITHAPTIVTAVCDSTTTTVESSSTAHQKPNQAIAPSQPRLQTSHNQTKTSNEVTQIIVRLQKPVQQQSVIQPPPNVIQRKAPSPVKRIVNTALINEQLKNDQNGAVNPNMKTPFSSTIDACCRLIKYHVYNTTDSSPFELAEAETAFQSTSVSHMDKIKSLKDRFNLAQMKSTMKPVPTSEEIYIQRLLIDEEQEALKEDKVAVAEGRELSLSLARQQWLYKVLHSPTPERPTSPDFEIQEEEKTCGDSCRCRDDYDPPNAEYSDPVYKDDDNLEAPVIDSCADIVVPQHNDNCDRSPPTLKRIVTKPIKFTESDPEDQIPARKRVKFNNNTVFKNEASVLSHDKPIISKYNDNLPKTNHKYPMTFQSESSLSDVVSDAELRKEFSMSPMEMDEAHIDSRLVNLDSSSEVNHLVDFEPLIPGTGESCDSNTLYNNSLRNNCVNYMLNEDWPNEFAHQPTELDIAVANIEGNHNNPAEIDLSGLAGLDAHFNNSQHCIPNGIQDDDTSVEMNLIEYRIPKQQKRYHDSSVQSVSNCSDMGDQTHSAIKSIIDPESRYDRISTEFMSLNRHNQNAHIGGYSSSASARNMGSTSMKKEDRNLDEAVRSILI
ncbi:GLTSCR1 domain-containing protein [Caerostris extrusa]|uniref:GLTSCR1 domain-containing protein n=1 Tax=Caerostris extrusa TaxID=172846 RepID=A0AAV4TMF9_CAEEX|nr:GLTSCR1 domain-containing protein [Caerostris extrusa]